MSSYDMGMKAPEVAIEYPSEGHATLENLIKKMEGTASELEYEAVKATELADQVTSRARRARLEAQAAIAAYRVYQQVWEQKETQPVETRNVQAWLEGRG